MPIFQEYFGYHKEQDQQGRKEESLSTHDVTLRRILSEQDNKISQLEKTVEALKIKLAEITKLLNEHGISPEKTEAATQDSEKEDTEVASSPNNHLRL